MVFSTKTLKFTSAAVYEINRSIEHSNKHKFSYFDDMVVQQKPGNSCHRKFIK